MEQKEEGRITEREKQLLKREGFLAGRAGSCNGCWVAKGAANCATCVSDAVARYPMPIVTRPLRGMFSTGYQAYAVEDGLHWRAKAVGVFRYYGIQDSLNAFIETKEDVLLLARMLSGETETVEDDSSLSSSSSSEAR